MQYETERSLVYGSNGSKTNDENKRGVERVMERMAGESAVVIFSESSCCMCHAIKRLFCGLGVSPTVHELDLLPAGHLISAALDGSSLPLVFVGGKLLGAMDRVMASHINGSLVPLLKDAGALWL